MTFSIVGGINLGKMYWMNELKDIYSFNSFLKDINNSKHFNTLKFHYLNDNNDLNEFLAENNITFFEFSTAIISMYLSRTTNSEGIIFSYSNLNSEDTLFKIKYKPKISLIDFIKSVKNIINNALDNSMENLKDYVNDIHPNSCDYIFNYAIANQAKNKDIENFNSSMVFNISQDSIEVAYDINTLNKIEMGSMVENIEITIDNCLKDINQSCNQVDIVCNRQLELLNEFSVGTDLIMEDKQIPDIILEKAEKYPENFAINDEINRITYAELSDLIKSMSYTLQNDYKIRKSDKIILYLPRSYHIPLLTICLMKIGAIVIPVDDSYPESYIQTIIGNCSPKYIIQEFDHDFDDVESIQLNDINTNEKGNLIDVDIDLDETALILYTSGTSGVPKGVELTQRNIININYNYIDYFNLPEGGSGNFMCMGKFTFVASLPVYAALLHGFEAFIIRETTKSTIANIVKYLKTYHTYVLITTEELGLYLYNNFDLNLDNLIFAGSSLSKAEITTDRSTSLLNAYGCTETSGSVIIHELLKDFSDYSVIGKPLGNSKVYILDDNKKQLPIGGIGEIVISGPVVTKQYFKKPEQTSLSYHKYNNEKAYFTNDLGYFDMEGNIIYVGRKDNQINLNGFRIEPAGVESVIFDYGGFTAVKVIKGKVNHQNHLIAYYSASVDIDEADLKEYLKIHLPSYMIPSFYVRMDILPLNSNGKIDVWSLPPVELNDVDFVKPRNDYEEIIVNIFEKVFNQENISVYDNFIDLGGTSIIAMKIVKELSDYNLSVTDLISLGTPEKIASHIKNNSLIDYDYSKYSLEEGCPLNESQLNVYLDIIKYEKKGVYNIPVILNIPNTYSADDINRALNEMFNVHPLLKSYITIVDGVPCLKMGNIPKVDYLKEYNEYIFSDFMKKHFDLNNNLSRFLLVEKDNDEGFILLSVFHHLIFDGLSSLVYKKHLYDLLSGKVLELDEGFVKSRVYDEEIVKTSQYSNAESFFESMLSEIDDISPLLSVVNDNEAGYYSSDLSINKSEIIDFLKSYGVSENILFTGAFAYTLSRFTGDNRVLFNILDNGRDNLSNYESFGMFVNTLPLVVDCKDQSISSFMEYMSDLVYTVSSYNFYPYRLLAKDYNVPSDILFQFMPDGIIENDLSYEGDLFKDMDNQILEPTDDFISDFDVEILQEGDNYILKIIYSDKYSKNFIEVFAQTYKMILEDIFSVDNLSNINYITASDLELLDAYNDTAHDLVYADVLDAFNDNLSKYPDNMLVSYEDRYYTYGEGAFIADKIALSLKDLGVKVQDKVAFLVERSELYMFCVLGVLSCGAIYVPLDDKHPDERIKFILEDTDASVVIVSDETYERALALATDSIIFNISDILKEDIKVLDKLSIGYGDLACVLYTSGTTGIPKGVKLTRKSLLNLSEFYIRTYGLSKDDVYGLFASIGFDVAIKGIFPSICSGAELCVVPNEIKLDMKDLNDYLLSHNVGHIEITTQVAKLFVSQVYATSLKVMTTGGEKLGDEEFKVDYRFVDSYGPTEACVDVTAIDTNDKIDYSSIGFLLDNIKAYILDEEFRRVPFGAVGELYLAGYQIAEGYLNRDEETKHSFIYNVFDDDEDYGVMYRTGDMVRFLPDGSLGIVGRRDGQVKIRGNRVELSEVEAVIRELDYVEDVTVQVVMNGSNYELAAYVVSTNYDIEGVDEDIKAFVLDSKPDYMVPSYVLFIDDVPLTVNGKVDKRALPKVNFDDLHEDYVPPSSETEKAIVEVFEKVFDIDKIGINDDFVKLGGDSLTAIKVSSLLDRDVDIKSILNFRTPYKIAQSITNDNEYGFNLIKEGTINQNMFLLPDIVGLSFVFSDFIDSINFNGNIYTIDDFKYDLSDEDIKNFTDNKITFDYYYDAIKDLFQDGDIIVGYSLGCVYASLIAEKLERIKTVGEIILIDGYLNFSNMEKISTELIEEFLEDNNYSAEFKEKLKEIILLNSVYDFNTPKINAHIKFVYTSDIVEDDLKKISDNYDFIYIDSTHQDIISKDVSKYQNILLDNINYF